jgi:hypothetical protein
MATSSLHDHTMTALDSPARLPPGPDEARALLRMCYIRYATKLADMAHASLDMAGDLFEPHFGLSAGEARAFRRRRSEWQERFVKALTELFDRRLAGQPRQGRRPDADASASSLRLLTAFDYDKQAALVRGADALARLSRQEIAALDLRVAALLDERPAREPDNPFSMPYLLDALGSTSRAVYPNPRVWRPLMERLLSDMTLGISKLYISLNRTLADRGVLPNIKAELRARSPHRPQDDRDLFATFTRMLGEANPAALANLSTPALSAEPGAPPARAFARRPAAAVPEAEQPTLDARTLVDRLNALASAGAAGADNDLAQAANLAPESTPATGPAFLSLNPLLAQGASALLFARLAQWQNLDLAAALTVAPTGATRTVRGAAGNAGPAVPRNLVPHIHAAIAGQMSSEAEPVTLDVIALLFDYIFRDPSIPESARALFARLEVPIVKAALLDRSFFSDHAHPARRLLDHLAEAAMGAAGDERYSESFTKVATEAVDRICTDFEIDVSVFESAIARLSDFVEAERRTTSTALFGEVAAALAAEERDADRSAARATVRDRLAGTDAPVHVRAFIETTWSEHLADLRRRHGENSEPWNGALATLDDLLWSIVVKERAGQKARLTKLIPSLVASLRQGCAAQQVPPERSRAFFDSLYALHMAAIKPPLEAPSRSAPDGAEPVRQGAGPDVVAAAPVSFHDFVGEMVVGTWLAFAQAEETVHARLTWISPLRTRYVFTSHAHARAFMRAPEDLAFELASGQAALLVEPVPLWDRAVSSALDTIAAERTPAANVAPARPGA